MNPFRPNLLRLLVLCFGPLVASCGKTPYVSPPNALRFAPKRPASGRQRPRTRLHLRLGKGRLGHRLTAEFNRANHRLANGRPITVQAVAMGSGECIDELIEGTRQAHLTSPTSAAYIDLGNARWRPKSGGKDLLGKTDSLLLSPVVIALWQPTAEALGWPGKPVGWADILALARNPQGWAAVRHPERGVFKFGHTHPNESNSGLMTLVLMAYDFSNPTPSPSPASASSGSPNTPCGCSGPGWRWPASSGWRRTRASNNSWPRAISSANGPRPTGPAKPSSRNSRPTAAPGWSRSRPRLPASAPCSARTRTRTSSPTAASTPWTSSPAFMPGSSSPSATTTPPNANRTPPPSPARTPPWNGNSPRRTAPRSRPPSSKASGRPWTSSAAASPTRRPATARWPRSTATSPALRRKSTWPWTSPATPPSGPRWTPRR